MRRYPPGGPAITSPVSGLLRPEQRPDLAELFFSSSGRLSRLPFTAALAGMLGLAWLCARWAAGWTGALAAGSALVLVFSGCCLVSRRLHDLGLAGWWTVGVALLATAPWLAQGTGPAACGVLLVVGLGLCLTPGRSRSNRFGPALTP